MDDRERQAWIQDVKRRYGIRCIGDEEERPAVPEWPVLPEGATYVPYRYFGMSTMVASWDLVHWYAKPEGVTTEEFLSSPP